MRTVIRRAGVCAGGVATACPTRVGTRPMPRRAQLWRLVCLCSNTLAGARTRVTTLKAGTTFRFGEDVQCAAAAQATERPHTPSLSISGRELPRMGNHPTVRKSRVLDWPHAAREEKLAVASPGTTLLDMARAASPRPAVQPPNVHLHLPPPGGQQAARNRHNLPALALARKTRPLPLPPRREARGLRCKSRLRSAPRVDSSP